MIALPESPVTLNSGFWVDGRRYQQAALRPVIGEDEMVLATLHQAPLARQVTVLLARCLTHVGPQPAGDEQIARALTIGDREALLLHLRRLTFGDDMDCVMTCPNVDCGQQMDLQLQASTLLLPPYTASQLFYTTVSEDGDTRYRVRFRLPNGSDQEAAAACLAEEGEQAAARLILQRCVEHVERLEPGPDVDPEERPGVLLDDPTVWPATLSRDLPGLMSKLDPQAELTLRLSCPVCDNAFVAILDTGSYFLTELSASTMDIYRQVHFLALHYGWSEVEILAMTASKRRIYLELLREAAQPQQTL